MAYRVKLYVVQRAGPDGSLLPEIPIAIKLTFADAALIARQKGVAPAKVTLMFADKTTLANGGSPLRRQDDCLAGEDDSKG